MRGTQRVKYAGARCGQIVIVVGSPEGNPDLVGRLEKRKNGAVLVGGQPRLGAHVEHRYIPLGVAVGRRGPTVVTANATGGPDPCTTPCRHRFAAQVPLPRHRRSRS